MSQRKRLIITGMSGLVAVAFLAASPTSADTLTNTVKKIPGINRLIHKNTIIGTVSTVSGTTFTLNNQERHASTTVATLYTVDATNAVVYKNGATSTVSAIMSGDRLVVRGTISGTNVTATNIIDGMMGGFGRRGFEHASSTASSTIMMHRPFPKNASSTEAFRSNFTLGNVTAVNGSDFTITDKGYKNSATTTYSVITDGSTVFKKAGQSASLSDVTVGQFVMVAGAKNSSNDTITATSVNVITKGSGDGKGRGPRGAGGSM